MNWQNGEYVMLEDLNQKDIDQMPCATSGGEGYKIIGMQGDTLDFWYMNPKNGWAKRLTREEALQRSGVSIYEPENHRGYLKVSGEQSDTTVSFLQAAELGLIDFRDSTQRTPEDIKADIAKLEAELKATEKTGLVLLGETPEIVYRLIRNGVVSTHGVGTETFKLSVSRGTAFHDKESAECHDKWQQANHELHSAAKRSWEGKEPLDWDDFKQTKWAIIWDCQISGTAIASCGMWYEHNVFYSKETAEQFAQSKTTDELKFTLTGGDL